MYQPIEMTNHTFQYPKVTPVSPPASPSLQTTSAGTAAQGSGSGRRSS